MASNRIQIDGRDGDYLAREAISGEAVKPGNILEFNSSGYFIKHNKEGDFGRCIVAVEDALQGDTVDDTYASGAKVQAHIERPGSRFQAIVKSGETMTIGMPLISDGEGRLIAQTSRSSDEATKHVMAYAEEAKTLLAADTLVLVSAA